MTTAMDSAIGTAKTAIDAAKLAAGGAADAVVGSADDAGKSMRRLLRFLRAMEVNDMLALFGLRRSRSALGTVALIGGGVALGVGITLLLSPASGREVRQKLLGYFQDLEGKAKEEAQDAKDKAKEVAGEAKDKAKELAGEVREKVGEAKQRVGELAGEMTQGREGEIGEAAQTEESAEDRRGHRRNNQRAQPS